MKKPVIALIALVIAAGGSTGAFLAVKNKNENEARKQQEILDDNVIFSIDPESIDKITFTFPDGKYTAGLDSDDNVWTLTEGGDFALNQSKMQLIATYMSALTADTNYEEITDDKKKMYGLDEPYTLSVSDGSRDYTVYIGDISPTGDYFYTMADGKSNIYGISYDSAVSLLADKFSIVSPKMTTYGDFTIGKISLGKDGETVYELTKDENSIWHLPDKYNMLTLNNANIESIITTLTRLEAQEILSIDPNEKSDYGFDKPDTVLTLTGDDGSQEKILFKITDSSDYVNAYIENYGFTEKYYSADTFFTGYEIYDLISDVVEGASMYSVNGFEFDCEYAADEFSIDNSTGIATCHGYEADLNNAEILSLFKTFYNLLAYITVSEVDAEAEPELNDPVFTAVYHLTSGENRKIQLVPTEENSEKCYVFLNEEYIGTVADISFLNSGNTSVIPAYQKFCEHAGIDPNMK
ncbi:MAG: DUF4340 domain-containing protein [Ruminococcus sp.]|nr:DUF4340 domain-containing protein [Ruminococcus sp.]